MFTEAPLAHLSIVSEPLTLKQLAEVLVRHYDLHEGLFDAMVEYQIGVGIFGPDPQNPLPGAMIGAHRIGLVRVEQANGRTVDAAIANPAKEKKTATKKPTKAKAK